MRILFDHQIFSNQIFGGISRYFTEIIEYMYQDNDDMYCVFPKYFSNNYYLKNSEILQNIKFFDGVYFKGKHRITNIVNKFISKRFIKKSDYYIFHPTYYDPYFLDYIGNQPFVLTIYDMIHEIYPKNFSNKDSTSERKYLLAKKANKIIAISECTKRDIIKYLNIKDNKIEVIYLGNSLFHGEEEKQKRNIPTPEKYFLYVGNRGGYKNFIPFIEAIADFLRDNKEINVVCAGGHHFKDFEVALLEKYKIKDKVQQLNVDDKKLAYLYKNAVAFVFPSLYEGFGIPILESFSCGCPVVCSNTSSLPEVAGEAALYFDPLNKDEILEKIKEIYNLKSFRESLIKKGYSQLKKFSWEKTYQKTKDVYRSLL